MYIISEQEEQNMKHILRKLKKGFDKFILSGRVESIFTDKLFRLYESKPYNYIELERYK